MVSCTPPISRNGIRYFGWSTGGVEVCFTSREGGASIGPYSGLNVDPHRGDEPAAVAANQRRVLDALAVPGIFLPRQVHGTAILTAGEIPAGFSFGPEGDAVVGDRKGTGLGVMTADCLPLLLHHPGAHAGAAVHAGWRSLVGGIIPGAVRTLGERWGGETGDLEAFLGPCIGPCCYEVDEEVADEIAAAAGSREVIRATRPQPSADLRRAAVLQLLAAGLKPERIRSVDLCTSCRADLFYSYRRDGERTGRMAAVIVVR